MMPGADARPLSRRAARALLERANEAQIDARAAMRAGRLEVHAETPWHKRPVALRDPEDIEFLTAELKAPA